MRYERRESCGSRRESHTDLVSNKELAMLNLYKKRPWIGYLSLYLFKVKPDRIKSIHVDNAPVSMIF